MPNLTGLIARGHMAGRIGFVQTAGFGAGGSAAIQDMSAGRGDKIISVVVVRRTLLSYTAGYAANASDPIGGVQVSGGVSESRSDVILSVVAFGTPGTLIKVSSTSVSIQNNRLLIADYASSNEAVQLEWSVGAFAGRKIPDGSVTISASRVKISDIATNGHALAVRWWKGMRP